MRTLLDPEIAAQYLLQPSSRDVSLVIFFNSKPSAPLMVEGNDPNKLRGLLRAIDRKTPGGGTNMYVATAQALAALEQHEDTMGEYHSAVIVMSDGQSKGQLGQVRQASLWKDVPVYTILFGKADTEQMQVLAESTAGRMFDGRKDMIHAFRQAKGYN